MLVQKKKLIEDNIHVFLVSYCEMNDMFQEKLNRIVVEERNEIDIISTRFLSSQ